jgi:hypothetical protein
VDPRTSINRREDTSSCTPPAESFSSSLRVLRQRNKGAVGSVVLRFCRDGVLGGHKEHARHIMSSLEACATLTDATASGEGPPLIGLFADDPHPAIARLSVEFAEREGCPPPAGPS